MSIHIKSGRSEWPQKGEETPVLCGAHLLPLTKHYSLERYQLINHVVDLIDKKIDLSQYCQTCLTILKS